MVFLVRSDNFHSVFLVVVQVEGKELRSQLGSVADQCVKLCKCTVVVEKGQTRQLLLKKHELAAAPGAQGAAAS